MKNELWRLAIIELIDTAVDTRKQENEFSSLYIILFMLSLMK